MIATCKSPPEPADMYLAVLRIMEEYKSGWNSLTAIVGMVTLAGFVEKLQKLTPCSS